MTVLAGDGHCNSSVLATTNVMTGKETAFGLHWNFVCKILTDSYQRIQLCGGVTDFPNHAQTIFVF